MRTNMIMLFLAGLMLTACTSPYAPPRYAGKPYADMPYDCPNWRHTASSNHENSPLGNLGCASMANKRLMVADPNDLIRGKRSYGTDTESAVRAITQHYGGELAEPTASDETVTRDAN